MIPFHPEPLPGGIRLMRLDDLEAVHEIDKLSFALPWPRDSFRYELMENDHAQVWVAEDTAIIGVIVVWLILDEVHIATLAVHPDYRRQGWAQRLLAVALMDACRRGVRAATLEVREGNSAALELYRRFGFKEVGRRRSYYQDNHEDALLLTADGLGEEYYQRAAGLLQVTAAGTDPET